MQVQVMLYDETDKGPMIESHVEMFTWDGKRTEDEDEGVGDVSEG